MAASSSPFLEQMDHAHEIFAQSFANRVELGIRHLRYAWKTLTYEYIVS